MELARTSKTEKNEADRQHCRPLQMMESFEVECQQALMKKERRAKNNLMELDTGWQYHPTDKSTLWS